MPEEQQCPSPADMGIQPDQQESSGPMPDEKEMEALKKRYETMFERAEEELKWAILDTIRKGSVEEGKQALDDLKSYILETERVAMNPSGPGDDYDWSVAQDIIDMIGEKYKVRHSMFKVDAARKIRDRIFPYLKNGS